MIKKIMLMAMIMVCSVSAHAYTECVGGTIIKRNQYGTEGAPDTCTATTCPSTTKTFCKSDERMNWWSAFNWCKSNGGTLASFESMCPGVTTAVNNTEGACPGLQGVGSNGHWVWSSMGYQDNYVLGVHLFSGGTLNNRRVDSFYALCE